MKQDVADDEAEHGVAEELEGLIVADVAGFRLVLVRLVGECAGQKLPALKVIADALFEFRQVGQSRLV